MMAKSQKINTLTYCTADYDRIIAQIYSTKFPNEDRNRISSRKPQTYSKNIIEKFADTTPENVTEILKGTIRDALATGNTFEIRYLIIERNFANYLSPKFASNLLELAILYNRINLAFLLIEEAKFCLSSDVAEQLLQVNTYPGLLTKYLQKMIQLKK